MTTLSPTVPTLLTSPAAPRFGSVHDLLGANGGFPPAQGARVSITGLVVSNDAAHGGLLLTDRANMAANGLIDAFAALPLVGNVDGLRPGQHVTLDGVVDVRKRLDGRTTVLHVER